MEFQIKAAWAPTEQIEHPLRHQTLDDGLFCDVFAWHKISFFDQMWFKRWDKNKVLICETKWLKNLCILMNFV